MGKSYAQIKNWGKARWAFKTCLKINPNYPEAKQNMEYIGQQSYVYKNYNNSIIIYKDLAQINKHKKAIRYYKGRKNGIIPPPNIFPMSKYTG